MRKMITGKLTSGLLCVFMVLSVFFATGVFAASTETDTIADVTNTSAVEEIGIKYCGHVQNVGDVDYVNGPEALGTRGRSLRIEGFCFELTGDVPAGANLEYQVHVQNYGWMTPVEAGQFAGTRGESLRVESIRIKLVNLPGYDVYYQGHVQNVGDIPQVNGEWGWVKNGEELGTTGSSLRLEEIKVKIVKQPSTITSYDKAGTYGPKTGAEEINGDAVINVPDVTLQNLHITGTLTIGEGVGDGNVTLNNVTVDGDTFIRGGGENSIHINSGNYARIVVEKTASGNVRIVCTTASGIPIVVSEDAAGEELILEGLFSDVTINAPDFVVKTQGDTTIKNMTIGEAATGCEVTLAEGTTVEKLILDSGADVKGKGTINKAEVNADGVKFETAPKEQVVDPGVVTPPVVTPPVVPPVVPPGGGGGTTTISVTGVTIDTLTNNLVNGDTLPLTATVSPSSATNKTVTWSTNDSSIATVNSNGLVTTVGVGKAIITATTADGSKVAKCYISVYGTTGDISSAQTTALTAINGASDAAAMKNAITTNEGILWSPYFDLSNDRQTAVVNDMLTNKSGGYSTKENAELAFDLLSCIRSQIEVSLAEVNSATSVPNLSDTAKLNEGLAFLNTIVSQFQSANSQYPGLKLSGQSVNTLASILGHEISVYNGYSLNKKQSILNKLYNDKPYNSLSTLLTKLQEINDNDTTL